MNFLFSQILVSTDEPDASGYSEIETMLTIIHHLPPSRQGSGLYIKHVVMVLFNVHPWIGK